MEPGLSDCEIVHCDTGINFGGAVMTLADRRTAQYLGNLRLAHTDSIFQTTNGWRRISRFTRPVDASVLERAYLYEPRQLGAGTIISGCAFRNGRLAGAVIQTPLVLVEDTVFSNIKNECVRLGALGDWHEGPPPYSVLIRNCRFSDSGTGVGSWLRMCDETKTVWHPVRSAPVRGIELVENHYANLDVADVSFRHAADVRRRDAQEK